MLTKVKRIKFNLSCGGNTIRSLDDLQRDFYIDEVLDYYRNGLLQKWLEVRDYQNELAAVSAIKATEDLPLASELVSALGVETDGDKLRKDLFVLQYRKERAEGLERLQNGTSSVQAVTGEYFRRYESLSSRIVEEKGDFIKVRALLEEMVTTSSDLVRKNIENLFWDFYYGNPLAVFGMLAFEAFRELLLFPDRNEIISACSTIDDLKAPVKTLTTIKNRDDYLNVLKGLRYKQISRLCLDVDRRADILKGWLKTNTGGNGVFWKNVEPDNIKILVINLSKKAFVNNARTQGGELDSSYCNMFYPILKGLEFQGADDYKVDYLEL
ncbi:MAG: hypothetical protein LBO05_08505 [Deltaproteobacteria bacterium]|jgi:hypothetical protein|nr:hypothetical protein [Deltaproteobacteria bacterium]